MSLQEKMDFILKLEGVFLVLVAVMSVLAALQFGLPSNISHMNQVQDDAFKMVWGSTAISVIVSLVLAFFCFRRKTAVIFIFAIYLLFNLNKILFNVHQLFSEGYMSLMYLFANLWGLISLLALILSVILMVLFFSTKYSESFR